MKDVPGVILYREFSNAENVIHATSIGGTTGASYYNPTRDLVDSYLCSDGKTRWNSPLYKGDKDMYDEFSCRDHRLWLQVTPPYRIDRSASTDAWGNKWQFTEVAKDRSFIDSLNIRLGIGYGSAKERQKLYLSVKAMTGGSWEQSRISIFIWRISLGTSQLSAIITGNIIVRICQWDHSEMKRPICHCSGWKR